MCIQSTYYFVIASVIDIVMFFIYGVICWNILPHDEHCFQLDVITTLAGIVLVSLLGLHLLEMIMKSCFRNTEELQGDNQFNPGSFYCGIFFTLLHLIKFILVCALILPNLKDSQEACGNIIIAFSAFYVAVAVFVVVMRVIGHIKQIKTG